MRGAVGAAGIRRFAAEMKALALRISDRPHASLGSLWKRGLGGARRCYGLSLVTLDRRGAGGQEQAMGLTNDGVPADSAKFLGNRACRMSLPPKRLQHLDAFGRPDHIHWGTLNMLWATHYAPTRGSRQEENRRTRLNATEWPEAHVGPAC